MFFISFILCIHFSIGTSTLWNGVVLASVLLTEQQSCVVCAELLSSVTTVSASASFASLLSVRRSSLSRLPAAFTSVVLSVHQTCSFLVCAACGLVVSLMASTGRSFHRHLVVTTTANLSSSITRVSGADCTSIGSLLI